MDRGNVKAFILKMKTCLSQLSECPLILIFTIKYILYTKLNKGMGKIYC